MSKNEELIRAIKDAENAITKALNTLKKITESVPKDNLADEREATIQQYIEQMNRAKFHFECHQEAERRHRMK